MELIIVVGGMGVFVGLTALGVANAYHAKRTGVRRSGLVHEMARESVSLFVILPALLFVEVVARFKEVYQKIFSQ